MISSPVNDVHKLFYEAAMVEFASENLSGQDWEEFQQIRDEGAAKEKELNDRFAQEYMTRVEQERKRLINEAGEKNKNFDLFGSDRFDKDAINRQAQRNVRFAHERDLKRAADDTENQLTSLLERAGVTNEFRERHCDNFSRAANEKRTRTQNRDR